MVFDVDRLKRINDLLGHATGDEALRQVGLALRETLRTRDVIGRLGGDEFAVAREPVHPTVAVAVGNVEIARRTGGHLGRVIKRTRGPRTTSDGRTTRPESSSRRSIEASRVAISTMCGSWPQGALARVIPPA